LTAISRSSKERANNRLSPAEQQTLVGSALAADQVTRCRAPSRITSRAINHGSETGGQVRRESADELMIRRFAGAQRDGIGRFVADPVSGQWSWSDAVFQIFGYRARSVAPSWSLIINHIPEEDRAVAQTAYELATTHVGPFSWSHRIRAGDAMRSIMVLGETSPLDGVNSLKRTGQRSGQLSENQRRHAGLYLEGYVIDLTVLRVEGTRGATTEAVQSSARHRAVIEQAKGVLMLTFGLNVDAAFALLVWHSQRSNRKVHAIAADLVAHLDEDGLSGNGLRLAMERILTNGEAREKRHASAPPTPR
jgi:PAS domain-containing protein